MSNLKALLVRFANDESGVTSIEYALIASATAVVLISSLTLIGSSLNSKWTSIKDALN